MGYCHFYRGIRHMPCAAVHGLSAFDMAKVERRHAPRTKHEALEARGLGQCWGRHILRRFSIDFSRYSVMSSENHPRCW